MLITLPAENYFANSHRLCGSKYNSYRRKNYGRFQFSTFFVPPYIKTRVKLRNILIVTKFIYYDM